jgi:WD40-like Beta Propeller Repeat
MDTPEHEQAEEPFEVEFADLDRPGNARHSRSVWPIGPLLGWQHSLTRRDFRLARALGMLALVLLLLLLSLPTGLTLFFVVKPSLHPIKLPPRPVQIRPSLVILPQQDGFACLVDTTWSPDSKRIAFLGYQHDCAQGTAVYEPGLMMVHDARSGKLVERLWPDSTILHALRMRLPRAHGVPVIYYDMLLWSPDGQRVALTFSVVLTPEGATPLFDGVLLADEDGGHAQVLLQPQQDSSQYTEWDLERGELRAVPPSPSIASSSFITVPPALAYRWAADGTLIPETRLTGTTAPSPPPLGPVGNPDGGTSFTIWQPGWAELTTEASANGPVHLPGVYSWNTVFRAWSPDGRYLVYPLALASRLEPTGQPLPSHQALVDFQLEQVPLLPVRDAAFQRVLEALPQILIDSNTMMVAWRLDGRMLAAYNADEKTLGLYDCTSGNQLASLLLPTSYGSLSSSNWLGGSYLNAEPNFIMSWSPDGSQLLLLDWQLGATLWSTKQ